MHVILAGATGLVGGALLAQLISDPRIDRVTTVGRRAPDFAAENVTSLTGAVEAWPDLVRSAGAGVAISTLGTTIRQAGSREAFAAVDLDAVVAFARAAKEGGAAQFLMVTSVGASATAANFYLQTKGRAEDAVRAIGFDRVDIFRPGLLRGDRGGPPRVGERLAMLASPLTDLLTPRSLDRYRSIAADDVARAMARASGQTAKGVFIHHNREMAG